MPTELETRLAAVEKENRIVKRQLARKQEDLRQLEETLSSHVSLLKTRNAELLEYQAIIQRSEEQYRKMAHYDALTGLPNRVLFQDHFEKAITRANREQNMVALLFIDLDRFKNVNDTAGHDAGDAILKETSCRLRACARKSDVVCRIGGDEFIVLIEKLLTPQLVEFFVERMLAKLAEDFVCTDQVYSINASIGVSIYPLDGGDLETLIHNADSAMYEVKKRGRNGWRFYNAALRHETEKSKGKQWFPG